MAKEFLIEPLEPACPHDEWVCREFVHYCDYAGCDYSWESEGDDVCDVCSAPAQFVTRDSGKREDFSSGAVRDTQDGKPRYDLIPPKGLKRVAELFARGAEKYEDHNWRKGMPSSRFMASMMRHAESYRRGERDEDHIAAVVFNALALIQFEDTEWDDLTELWSE